VYFETVKAALDACLPGICRHYGIGQQDALAYVREHLRTMSNAWFSGEQPNIVYSDPLCRFAYLFCHVAVNANLCEYAIRCSRDLAEFIAAKMRDTQELLVCAFGGGPGTELLALCKHLQKTRPNGPLARLSFSLLDRVPEWSESWNALEAEINGTLRAAGIPVAQWPFSISKTFVPFDMTQVGNFANMPHLFQQDLYVMNYVLSEILGDHAGFQQVITTAVRSSPSGSKFLIIDRDQDSVRDDAVHLLRAAGLNVSDVYQTSRNMDGDEQSSVLEAYSRQIQRQPRVQWGSDGRRGAFWIVGTKP
jgi:hypothetical protein